MNTSQLKKFAQAARTKLMEQVAAKLDYVLTHDTAELRGKVQTLQKLDDEIKNLGKKALVDKVAYTWFNRFIALRFMDANEFQPLGYMVVSPLPGQVSPQILDEAHAGHIADELATDRQMITDLLDGKAASTNPDNDVYRLLLVASCNHLSSVLPFLFERINDYTELLLPDDLTSNFSIVKDVVAGMPEEDCKEVEVIGWLYQFYISEKKDQVFAANTAVKKEDIPAATQLFTPRWIVEYMVQNTLGKLWLQNKPGSALKEHMPYYIESPSGKGEDYLKVSSVEEIRLLDQACGSGHILVYAFELFARIYEEEGYNSSDIPQLIIEKNLYGFEIDERAAQLAGMALMMKARGYNRRLFKKEVTPNILCFSDLALSEDEIKEAFKQLDIKLPDYLLADFKNIQQITNYGSLVRPETSAGELEKLLKKLNDAATGADMFLTRKLIELTKAVHQLIQLGGSFHCVVDNPPYMGGGKMNNDLSEYVKLNYPDSKADLMACFMEAGLNASIPKGFLGMINLPSWLFLSSFENLRIKLIKEKHIDSLLHMGRGIFGVDWGSTAFIIQNHQLDKDSNYFKLHKRNFQHLYPEDIQQIFLKAKNDPSLKINFDNYRENDGITSINDLVDETGLQISYIANQKYFEKIPGSPVGYWVSKKVINSFENELIGDNYEVREGVGTRNDERFIRFCWEAKINEIGVNEKWIRTDKAGGSYKWYNQYIHILKWENQGYEIKNYRNLDGSLKSRPQNTQYFYKEAISWSKISSGKPLFRYRNSDFGFNDASPSIFGENIKYLLGVLNSKVTEKVIEIKGATINLTLGIIKEVPLIYQRVNIIENLVENSIQIPIHYFNNNELLVDFTQNELIRIKADDLEETYDLYQQYWKNKFSQLHKNEEELNRQFIEIYGLQDELTPDVPLEDITILKEETVIENGQLIFKADEVFQQLVSYAVGCMFGRYSLDKEGLVLANQGQGIQDYLQHTGKTITELSFVPDEDNIIPVLDDEWFEDDIAARFRQFLTAAFGEKNFRKNLAFVEDCLGKDIRKYFDKDFYKDHVQRYKKRPIYWMFSSPQGHFKVLVYMHRYTPDTLNVILNSYLREFIEKLNRQRKQLEHQETSGTAAEQNKARKQMDKIDVMLADCHQYEVEILYPLAGERIEIDLDDGVLVNYNKFGKAVAPIAGLNDAKTKAKVRGFDWIDTSKIK